MGKSCFLGILIIHAQRTAGLNSTLAICQAVLGIALGKIIFAPTIQAPGQEIRTELLSPGGGFFQRKSSG
jgi:hypothetical protein